MEVDCNDGDTINSMHLSSSVTVKEEEVELEEIMNLDGHGTWHEPAGHADSARPMEGLHESGPTPFLRKTFEMVEDDGIDDVISWSEDGTSFVVWDQHEFSKEILPRYFKHSNFSSFMRQLNIYGFRKIDSDLCEFANVNFQGGKKHLLRNIKRKPRLNKHTKPAAAESNSRTREPEMEAQVEQLGIDQETLKAEILKLTEKRESALREMHEVEERVCRAERRHQLMLLFLDIAASNPNFIHELQDQQNRGNRDLGDRGTKKKTRFLDSDAATKEIDRAFQILTAYHECANEMESWNVWMEVDEEPSSVFRVVSEELLGEDSGAWGGDIGKDEIGVNETEMFLELEGLIEKPCGFGGYGSEMMEQTPGLVVP